MAERDFRFERHYELWKEQNKQVARWAFGTAIFAAILLLRVLAPYTDFSRQIATARTEQGKVEAELASIEAGRATLAKVGKGLEAVSATIERQPWMEEKDRLIVSLRDLSRAHQTLRGAPPARVLEAIRQPIAVTQAPIAQQIAPPPRQPDPLAQAATMLGLDAGRISGVEPPGEFRRLLEEQARRRGQEEADDKVRRIFQRVDDQVIQPLERLLREDVEAGRSLPAISPMLARTRADMDQWVRQHLGRRDWYETIQGKEQQLREVTDSLRQRQEGLIILVRDQQQALEPKKKLLAGRQRQTEEQATVIGKALTELNAKMQKLLPEWLRDLVSPEEMLQLYPLVLVGLVGILGFKAVLVRHHYLIVRESESLQALSFRDSAVSSPWTLVYRGAAGTVATSVVYLGGIVLLWWLFGRGSGLAAGWVAAHPSTPWAASKDWLSVIRWLGHLMFVAAMIGVAGTLLKDRAAIAGRSSIAAISHPPSEASSLLGDASSPGGKS